MKQITIDGKVYDIDCNAFTYVQYRNVFNRGIFEDIQILTDYISCQAEEMNKLKNEHSDISELELIKKVAEKLNSKIDAFIEAVTRIAYILIYTANENLLCYEDFLKGIKKFKIDDKWIVEVTEFAVNCFC